tara:strand:+ start:24 stop:692 length:669 start_codon:yes stop_codon:yes gene_type:complete
MTIISIEGNIGSGKESVLNVLKKYLKDDVTFLEDTVYNWNDKSLLSNFYKNPERWSFCIQIQSITQKYKRFMEILPHKKSEFVMFTHRSPMSDKSCFKKACTDMKYMTDKENEIYNSVFETHRIPKFHGLIYLKSNVNMCYENIISRKDKMENGLNFDFINRINDNYETWINKLKEENVVILEIDIEEYRDIEGNELLEERLMEMILKKFEILKHTKKKMSN